MKILLDANMPRSAIMVVQAAGHTVEFARDVGLGAVDDSVIAQHAKKNGMCIVTRDFDFSDIRNYPPHEYHGIIVLDLPDTARANEVSGLLRDFTGRSDFEQVMPGRLAVVRPGRARFRPRLP